LSIVFIFFLLWGTFINVLFLALPPVINCSWNQAPQTWFAQRQQKPEHLMHVFLYRAVQKWEDDSEDCSRRWAEDFILTDQAQIQKIRGKAQCERCRAWDRARAQKLMSRSANPGSSSLNATHSLMSGYATKPNKTLGVIILLVEIDV